MSNTPALALGKVCAACGKERKSRALKYDANTFMPYCDHPYICSDAHPNSPRNIVMNQKETELLSFDESTEAYKKYLMRTYSNPHIIKKISRMLIQPITLRIQDPEMAKFLAEFEDSEGLSDMSSTIRHCIQIVLENKGIYMKEHREASKKVEQTQAANKAVEEIETETEPEVEPENSNDLGTF
jgi:hypothetical protein